MHPDATIPPVAADRRALIGRRELVLGGLAATASAVAGLRQPEPRAGPLPGQALEQLVPQRFAGWIAAPATDLVMPGPDDLSERIYDGLVTRVYHRAGSPPIMLLLGYRHRQDGIVQLHRPEVCYAASGFTLQGRRPIAIARDTGTIAATALTAARPGRTEQVLYFTRIGRVYPRSWWAQRWAILVANLDGVIPDGLLVRVSLLSDDQPAALRLLPGFVVALADAGSPGFRRLIAGVDPR